MTKWSNLPKGGFTGIDWAKPDATKGVDPYLVWAEADDFAGYGLKKPPKWLPLLIELRPNTSIAAFIAAASATWLKVPPVYTSTVAPVGLRYCTAQVRPAFFKQIRPGGSLHFLVKRVELGLPATTAGDKSTPPSKLPGQPPQPLLKGKVMGVIDGGLAFANANFLRNGKARTKYFWRQDTKGVGRTPQQLGYGLELTAADIDKSMQANTYNGLVDEDAVYKGFQLWDLEKSVNHGTHVVDLACGPRTMLAQMAGAPPSIDAPPSWAPANDAASTCDIVAVQLDWQTVLDTSGGSMNVHIMDGLMYILSCCANDTKVATTISWGTLAGPHDGSSILEAAIDELIALKSGLLHVTVPAGNSYQSRTHANATLAKNETVVFHWHGQPGDATQNFLELWLPPGANGLTIELKPPGNSALPPLAWGESKMWADHGKPLCALIYPKAVATGTRGTCALIAVAPTFSFKDSTATAPCGVWQIKLTNTATASVTVDAYIERDDVAIGTNTGARQSYFEDKWYDTSGNPSSFVDHPNNPTPIRRSGNFNSISTGKKTLSVGGIRVAGPTWAHYSPRKPDPDASRPSRPDVVKVPDTMIYSDYNPALLGLRGAGTRSSAVVRLVGTSGAAPQVTRKIFNAL